MPSLALPAEVPLCLSFPFAHSSSHVLLGDLCLDCSSCRVRGLPATPRVWDPTRALGGQDYQGCRVHSSHGHAAPGVQPIPFPGLVDKALAWCHGPGEYPYPHIVGALAALECRALWGIPAGAPPAWPTVLLGSSPVTFAGTVVVHQTQCGQH